MALTVDKEVYSIPLTVFVSYMATPESGVQGTLGLALSRYNIEMNFLQQLSTASS